MSAYMGPWKAGMLVTTGLGGAPVDFRLTQEYVDQWTKVSPCGWRPVRPADDDVEMWSLFLPSRPLPNTGPKEFKPGQVWACHAAYPGKADQAIVFKVVRVADQSRQWLDVVTLAGEETDGMSNPEYTERSVLLFDAPETTAKPADRPLAPGWIRSPQKAYRCTNAPHRIISIFENRPAAAVSNPVSGQSLCHDCAELAGVYAPANPAKFTPIAASLEAEKRRVAEMSAARSQFMAATPARCGKCSHAGHSGMPCGGTSPGGEFRCPCGDLTAKDAKLAARGAYAVGKYGDTGKHGLSGSREWAAAQTGVALGLASERPPVRELPRVRDIYLPGASDDGDGRLGWTR